MYVRFHELCVFYFCISEYRYQREWIRTMVHANFFHPRNACRTTPAPLELRSTRQLSQLLVKK